MKRLLVLALAALLVPAVASAKKKKRHPFVHESLGDGWFFVLPAKARVGCGYTNGAGSLDVEGAELDLSLRVRPELRLRTTAARIALELGYRHAETFGYSLREGRFDAGLSASARLGAGFRGGARGDLAYVWRPAWPDLYQPILGERGEPTGLLGETDRYSHFDLGGEGWVGWRASKAFEIDLYGGYRDRRYRIDPAFDAVLAPTHVVPFTSYRIAGGARADGRIDLFRWLVDLGLESIHYRYQYARDRETGLTHAGPGGPIANPLQRFFRVSIREKNRFWIRALRTHAGIGLYYGHNEDIFEGYYSYDDFGGEVSIRVRPIGALAIEAEYEPIARRYGNSSKPNGERTAAFHRALLRVEYGFWRRRLTPFLEASLRVSSTNFPDYVPFENPPGQLYDIDFDYLNVRALAGLELEL